MTAPNAKIDPEGTPQGPVQLPAAPVLVAGLERAVWLTPDGEILGQKVAQAAEAARERPPILCHARATARRLETSPFPAFDVLELFAFVRPASFTTPTPGGLIASLGLTPADDLEQAAVGLRSAAERLLRELAAGDRGRDPDARAIAWTMARAGWSWGPAVLAALGPGGERTAPGRRQDTGLRVWEGLPAWDDQAPEPPPGSAPVEPAEARARLAALLGNGAEARPQQADYASAVSLGFAPRDEADAPNLVLAEAGASLWAELNGAPVWISTYTRNLQHQIDDELDRLFHPAPAAKRAKRW